MGGTSPSRDLPTAGLRPQPRNDRAGDKAGAATPSEGPPAVPHGHARPQGCKTPHGYAARRICAHRRLSSHRPPRRLLHVLPRQLQLVGTRLPCLGHPNPRRRAGSAKCCSMEPGSVRSSSPGSPTVAKRHQSLAGHQGREGWLLQAAPKVTRCYMKAQEDHGSLDYPAPMGRKTQAGGEPGSLTPSLTALISA